MDFGSGATYSIRPDIFRSRPGNDRSIITAILVRMAVDAAQIQMRHVVVDENDYFKSLVPSGLNNCLTVEANIDQTGRDLIQDIVMTICNEGTAAIVATDTTINPEVSDSYDVQKLRVGNVVQWYPKHVKISLYNEATGRREDVTLEKRVVAIVNNPFYAIMNEPNSTLQRLLRKLGLLDSVDEATSSGKLDLIIQLPYVIKSEEKRKQAEQRRTDIEMQLRDGRYGIAYTDGTERVTQLNRPAENNLLGQIQYLSDLLYGQLGVTPDIMNGTASEAVMINYYNRTIEPFLSAIADALKRTFLSKNARTRGQTIKFYRDPFKLVPIASIADIADKFTRNEIATSNEIRAVIGMKPSNDPKADELRNSNMPAPSGPVLPPTPMEGESQNGS